MSPPRQRDLAGARLLGGAGALASCLPMVAMLPSGFAAALGFIGLGTSSAAVSTLAPQLNTVAQPLLLLSASVLTVANLRCSLLPVATAAGGGILLYLSMYVITRADGTATPALFYPGLALFLATYPASFSQRRRTACRPLIEPRRGRALLAATLSLGVALVAASAASGFGSADPTGPSHRATNPGTPRHRQTSPATPAPHRVGPVHATPGPGMDSMHP